MARNGQRRIWSRLSDANFMVHINGQGGNALKNDGPFIRIKEQLIPGATMKVIVSAKGDDVSKISRRGLHDIFTYFLYP